MKTVSFQYYPSRIDTNKPIGEITFEKFLRVTKKPDEKTKRIFADIQAAELIGDKKLKAELKQKNLFYFTPCVQVYPVRQYKYIRSFTGLLVLDFDHIDNAPELKQFLFDEYPCINAAWLSPSRRGVKALVRIPIVNSTEEFKELYFGIAAEVEQFNGFDPSGQNCVLPLFQSYDPELLYRETPTTWITKGFKRSDFDRSPVLPPLDIDPMDTDKQIVLKIINTGFTNIIDFGHPPLKSLCIAIGGYVAAGYIAEYEALRIIESKIETHPYLSKGISGYKKTAKWAIKTGLNKPLTLNYKK